MYFVYIGLIENRTRPMTLAQARKCMAEILRDERRMESGEYRPRRGKEFGGFEIWNGIQWRRMCCTAE